MEGDKTSMSSDMGGHHSTMMGSMSSMSSMMGGHADTGGFCSGGGTVMQNGFKSSVGGTCMLFLFPGAVLDSEGMYAAAVIGTFLLAFANEGLRWVRAKATAQGPCTALGKMPAWARELLMAAGFGCQMVLAYCLMLLVMMYEPILFSAVVLGLVAGVFTFGMIDSRAAARSAVAVSPTSSTAESDTAMGLEKAAPIATVCARPVSSATPCCDPSV